MTLYKEASVLAEKIAALLPGVRCDVAVTALVITMKVVSLERAMEGAPDYIRLPVERLLRSFIFDGLPKGRGLS